jgi:hypothetical protein
MLIQLFNLLAFQQKHARLHLIKEVKIKPTICVCDCHESKNKGRIPLQQNYFVENLPCASVTKTAFQRTAHGFVASFLINCLLIPKQLLTV